MNLNDAGNAGLLSGATMGTGTAAITVADWVGQNATLVGLGLTAFSILVGFIFKAISVWQDAKHKRIMQEQDAEFKRWQMGKKEPTEVG